MSKEDWHLVISAVLIVAALSLAVYYGAYLMGILTS